MLQQLNGRLLLILPLLKTYTSTTIARPTLLNHSLKMMNAIHKQDNRLHKRHHRTNYLAESLTKEAEPDTKATQALTQAQPSPDLPC